MNSATVPHNCHRERTRSVQHRDKLESPGHPPLTENDSFSTSLCHRAASPTCAVIDPLAGAALDLRYEAEPGSNATEPTLKCWSCPRM